jgi:WD40 repeat protein/beta-lactamase regulating signal transducer with metallopeptidase domain
MIAPPPTLLLAKVTALLLLGLVLDTLLRRRAALAMSSLWNAVLVVLVLFPVASLLAPRWYWQLPPVSAGTHAAPIESAAPDTANPAKKAQVQETLVDDGQPPAPSLPVATNSSRHPILSANTLNLTLTMVYALGTGLLLARLVVGWFAVRALRRDAVPLSGGIWAEGLKRAQASLDLAFRTRLVQSDSVAVPSALGIRDRVIVIPTRLATTADWGLVQAVLTHELAHLARGDLAWQILQRAVEAILWFHPLVWLASRRITFIRERVCDEFVVYAVGDANAYAQTLVDLVTQARQRQPLVCGLAIVRSGNLHRRLNALLESQGNPRLKVAWSIRWSLAAGSSILALVLGCLDVTRAVAVGQAADDQPVKRTRAGGMELGQTGVWREWATLRNHQNLVHGVAFAADGKLFATAGADGTVRLWDANTLKEKAVLKGHNASVLSVCFSPDGRTGASGDDNGIVRLWDVATGNERSAFAVGQGVVSLAFSPDGKTVATGGGMGWVNRWNIKTGKKIELMLHHGIESGGGLGPLAVSVAFSPDGTLMAAGMYDHLVRLWELPSGKELAPLKGHTGGVFSVAYSPNGKVLVSGAGHGDGTIKIWDVATRKDVGHCDGGAGAVLSVAFAPDGRTVAAGVWRSGSEKCQVELWDLVTRKRSFILGSKPEGIVSLAFSPNGEILAAACGNLYAGGRSPNETVADRAAKGEVSLWHRVNTAVAPR